MTRVVGPTPRQTGQTNRGPIGISGAGIVVSAPNPDVQSKLPETRVKTEFGTSLELAGQSPEFVAKQVETIMQQEFTNFSQKDLQILVDASIEAIRKIGLGPNTDITLIAREVQSTTMLFTQEATQLLMRALAKIQEVLSDNSDPVQNSQDSNKPPFNFLGPNIPSNQNPQGPVLAA